MIVLRAARRGSRRRAARSATAAALGAACDDQRENRANARDARQVAGTMAVGNHDKPPCLERVREKNGVLGYTDADRGGGVGGGSSVEKPEVVLVAMGMRSPRGMVIVVLLDAATTPAGRAAPSG